MTSNRFRTYTFASLADYEAGKATSFTRTLQPNVREGSQMNAALYMGDVARLGSAQITYGARLEGGAIRKGARTTRRSRRHSIDAPTSFPAKFT